MPKVLGSLLGVNTDQVEQDITQAGQQLQLAVQVMIFELAVIAVLLFFIRYSVKK